MGDKSIRHQHGGNTKFFRLLNDHIVGTPEGNTVIETTHVFPQISLRHEAPAAEVLASFLTHGVDRDVLLFVRLWTFRRDKGMVSGQQMVQPCVMKIQIVVGHHDPGSLAQAGCPVGECVVVEFPWGMDGLGTQIGDAVLLLHDDDVECERR